jgi:alkanesulfonate monooxygenase SsuD/methylene tetrahydromethanopterin reductase-like flavin-dependent oxidoreductase (luciferase family)
VLAYQRPGAADAHALYGTPDQITEGLAALQDAGVAYVLLIFETDVAQRRRFCDDVVPRLSEPAAASACGGSSSRAQDASQGRSDRLA